MSENKRGKRSIQRFGSACAVVLAALLMPSAAHDARGQASPGAERAVKSPPEQTKTSVVQTRPKASRTQAAAVANAPTAGQVSKTRVERLGNLTLVRVPEADLQMLDVPRVAGPLERVAGPIGSVRPAEPGRPSLTVTRPNAEDVWIAGQTKPVRWSSQNLQGPVKIDMVHPVSAQQYDFYPVVASTPNDGAFDFSVPANLGCNPHNFYLQIASLSGPTKAFSPPIEVYHEPIDMTCQIMDLEGRKKRRYYVFYGETESYLRFDVWLRNNGTQPQATVQTVTVRLIKEPEELVVGQEEFGFGSMGPRLWYKPDTPRKFNIQRWAAYQGREVNLGKGNYRVEVMVDPNNQLGEDPPMRADNACVRRFAIL